MAVAGRATWCPRSKNDDDARTRTTTTTVAALGEKLGRGTVKHRFCRPRGQSSVPETISENLKVRREREKGERLNREILAN